MQWKPQMPVRSEKKHIFPEEFQLKTTDLTGQGSKGRSAPQTRKIIWIFRKIHLVKRTCQASTGYALDLTGREKLRSHLHYARGLRTGVADRNIAHQGRAKRQKGFARR